VRAPRRAVRAFMSGRDVGANDALHASIDVDMSRTCLDAMRTVQLVLLSALALSVAVYAVPVESRQGLRSARATLALANARFSTAEPEGEATADNATAPAAGEGNETVVAATTEPANASEPVAAAPAEAGNASEAPSAEDAAIAAGEELLFDDVHRPGPDLPNRCKDYDVSALWKLGWARAAVLTVSLACRSRSRTPRGSRRTTSRSFSGRT
jgi:hypothetical protein